MSSSKNKRKRPENDTGVAAPASRRRSRDQRAAPEPALLDNKNEQEENPSATATEEQMGEASVAEAPAKNQQEQGDGTGNTPRADAIIPKSADDTTSGEKAPEIPIKQGEDTGASSTSEEKVSTSQQEASKNPSEPASSASVSLSSAHKMEDASKAGDVSKSAGDSRKSRIQGLIAHRKILLDRIRLTRLACQEKLEATKTQGQEAGGSKPPVGEGAAPKEMTDDEEIEAHNEMARIASQAAKKTKQETEGGQSEKRIGLSLRRGASVGKKMNAALSSLAPGAGAHQTSDAPVVQPQHVASAQPPKFATKSAQLTGMLPKPPAAGGIPPPVRPMIVPQPQMVASKSIKNISPPPIHQPNSKQMAAGANVQKQRAPNSKSLKVATNFNQKMSSAARPESATLPLHAGTNPATLPPNRLLQRVHFPEAVALREKRSKIQVKLAKLLERQGGIDPTVKESSADRVSSSAAAATVSLTRKKPPPKLQANWEPKDPALLPKKRKTHWDYVMQEMAWMATDFIEERKWKLSSARTIGLAIRTPGVVVMAHTGARAAEPSSEKDATTEMPSDFKECKMEVEDYIARKKADAPVAKSFSVKAESQNSPRYIAPTMEDGKTARKVARIVSCMVSELISATLDSGAITRSDQPHREALERYLQLRRKLITDKSGASLASVTAADKKEHAKEATEKAKAAVLENGVEQMEVEPVEEKNEVVEEKSFESITEYIEKSLHEPAEGGHKSAKSEKPKVFDSGGLKLSSGQKDVVEFVEDLWEREHSPGAILSGTSVSGKTIATCSILWKQRSYGPQLLVCPPARLIRWMHELGGFKGMRVLPFGLTSGISSPFPQKPDLGELGEGDVIVCEYSALPRLVGVLWKDISKFHSFVIDCRHPVALSASYQSELEQKVSPPGQARKREWNCPAELISAIWWGDVLKFLLEGDARRLLIEFAKTDALSLSTSGLGDRQQLSILAFRAAYIIGPKIFQSPEAPIQKRIASWARHSGKKSTADKFARVRNLLEDSTKAFRCDIPGFVSLEDLSASSRANLWWELHHCSLPPCQRSAYDQSCAEVRGALSSSLASTHNDGESVFHSLKAVSSALFRLRRQCIHSNMRDIFTSSMMQNRLGPFCEALMDQSRGRMSTNGRTGLFDRKLVDSPSQPDSEIAFSILEGSAKLRELVSILKYECDYDLIGEEQLVSLLNSADREEPLKSSSKRKSSGPTKVAILAVLPEVQLLVSALLNSIGIKHDLLMRATSGTRLSNGGRQSSDVGVEEDSETERNQTSALAWAEFQTVLSKFNSDHSDEVDSVDVVITSPGVIAGDSGGLGIEKADLVVCLDEDWSGRGELMMKYIAARWLARNKVISTDRCRLIRLVCENTIEDKILTNEDSSKDESDGDVKSWPVDYSGHFLLPNSDTQAQVLYQLAPAVPSSNVCAFPGLNFLKFRGDLLSEVLVSSKDLPPMFGSGAKIRFLPLSESTIISEESSARHDEDEKIAEVAFLRDLLGRERIASLGLSAGGSNRQGIEESVKAVELTPFFVLPPSPSSFPAEMITRQDLPVVATRLYLERHAKLAVRNQLGIGSGRVSLALLPGIVGTTAAATSSAPIAAATAAISSSSDLADSWAKSGLSCKPDDFALRLLFYSESSSDPSNDDDGHKSVQSKKVGSQRGNQGNSYTGPHPIEVSGAPRTARRGNSYSKSFSAAREGNVFRDGNQGSEALVYFPPLFPNMLLCSMQAGRDTEALLASKGAAIPEGSYDDPLDMSDLPFKRKELEAPEGHGAPNSKRLRVQQPPIPSVASTGITVQAQGLLPGALPAATQATAASLAHSNQSISTGPQNQVVAVPNAEIRSDARRAIEDDGISSALFGVDEDYGLLGIGAIPLPDDAALSAAHAFVGTSAFTHPSLGVGHAFFDSANPCDAEEAEGVARQNRKISLKSMLLFVKKKPRGYAALPDKQGQLYRPPHGLPGVDAAWAGAHGLTPNALVSGGGNHALAEMNGAGSVKKVKKKPPNQGVVPMPSSAFSRLPSAEGPQGRPLAPMPSAVQFSMGKDGFRHRLLSSFVSRQIGTGLTMFESSSFRVAAVHVQNRVVDRLTQRCWQSSSSYDAGSGLPLLVAKQLLGTGAAGKRGFLDSDPNRWTSIVKRLKNSSETGDIAKSLSASQRLALRRSLVSPCRVDFGPFRGGFLAQPSGMTGISPPRPRLGVALPMGVKVPQTLREQSHDAWTARDEQLLQDCAVRFGMNWMLVARALSGFEDAVMTAKVVNASETNNGARSIARSARQCRDRWQALARTQPSLANEVRKSERVLRERALLSPDQIRCEDGNACRMSGAVIKGSGQNTIHLLAKYSLFVGAFEKSDLAGGISNSVAKDAAEPTIQNGNTEKEEPVVSMDIDGLSKNLEVGPTTCSNEQGLKVDGLKKQKRMFTSISLAKTKKQIIPMTIPGVVAGSPPTLVPSHPSHMQSVQESLSAQMSSGRTEMWPLQILDFADTQRAAATAAAQKPSSSGQRTAVAAARSSTTSSSSSSRRRTASSTAARSPSQASSDAQQQRPAPFPPVPASNARSAAQRPQATAASSQRSPSSMAAATAKAYAPPQAVAQAKPGQSLPPSK